MSIIMNTHTHTHEDTHVFITFQQENLQRHLIEQKKEEDRRKMANKTEGWNSSFVRSDAVVDSLAER